MSAGGVAQLIAIGAQDVYLNGNPEVSFFKSTYRRHTNFASVTEYQTIQGQIASGGTSTIRLKRSGDLLSHIYFTMVDGVNGTVATNTWSDYIDKVELLIGGQVIDEQDSVFSEELAPDLMAPTMSKSSLVNIHSGRGTSSRFYPLRFFFCDHWQAALPLVALQYHDVELRITWGASAASYTWEAYANYILLDALERKMFTEKPHEILMYQVQKTLGSNTKVQDLFFNNPVKFMASSNAAGTNALSSVTNKIKLQVNGTDVTEFRFSAPNFTGVQSYYNTSHSYGNDTDHFVYSFCLDTSKLQPTGSFNFSRVDSVRLISQTDDINRNIYAVNYNILKIENGMGGLMFAN